MTTERQYQVRCLDCWRDDDTPWLPMILRETCWECATHTVERHLLEHPGHRCEVLGSAPEESKDTQRLLGGNRR